MLVLSLVLGSSAARADLFGGDVAVLTQILMENIKQYQQLQAMIGQGNDQMNFLRDLNSGIDNSIGLLASLPVKDEKVLSDLREFKTAVQRIQSIYGMVPISPEKQLHDLHDQTVAESLRMANSAKDFSDVQEKNADVIRVEARQASPKGAARMQAETSAEILRTLSQLVRLNTQILKLQSESLAMNNKNSKEAVSNFQKVNRDLGSGFSNFKPDMGFIRF